jgi:D-serine deaminase-like pyridoxal phosphate-dependent protein
MSEAEVETLPAEDIAVTVLTRILGRRPIYLVVHAGSLALSKDRSSEPTSHYFGYGLGAKSRCKGLGHAIERNVCEEHGIIELDAKPSRLSR